MAGAGYKLFNTGDVLTAAQVNTYLQEQTVMVFADAAARTTALSGVVAEGMLSYLKDTDVIQYYNGSSWTTVNTDQTPLTTKGDLFTYSTTDARLGVGSNNQQLLADSAQATGLKWAPSATSVLTTTGDTLYASAANTLARLGIGSSGQVLTVSGGVPAWATPASSSTTLTQIATGTLSGADLTVSSLSSYDTIILCAYAMTNSTANGYPRLRINNNSGSNYRYFSMYNNTAGFSDYQNTTLDAFFLNVGGVLRTSAANMVYTRITNCKGSGLTDIFGYSTVLNASSVRASEVHSGVYNVSEAVSSIKFYNDGGNWAGGTYWVWGA